MPTQAQVQSETWWKREIVTTEAKWFGAEMARRTRRPATAFGCKGDWKHLKGAHRSQEWIKRSAFCTSRTYTVQVGLSAEQERWCAGFDWTPGNVEDMITQCKRIYTAMRAGLLDEVREFYGNLDGDRIVDGWDNIRDRPASSDSSHLWHWHLTLDRAVMNSITFMRRLLNIVLGVSVVPPTQPTESEIDMDRYVRTDKLDRWVSDGKTARWLANPTIADEVAETFKLGAMIEVGREEIGTPVGPVPDTWKRVQEQPATDLDALADKIAARLGAGVELKFTPADPDA